MKYEKQFEEFLKSDLFESKIKVIKEIIEQHFEDSFLFSLEEVIKKIRGSFSSPVDVALSNIYSEEAISRLIEENKIVKVKNSYILMKQFKKNYEFMNTFNDLSKKEKNDLVSKVLINKL